MIKGHGGNVYELAQRLGCEPSEIIDMSSNVNPMGPPPGLEELLKKSISSIIALPEVDSDKLVRSFADRYDLSPERILAGNGSTQFIYSIPKALESKKTLIITPTYADYTDSCRMHRVVFENFYTQEQHGFKVDFERLEKQAKEFDTVFICNPNNPTGILYSATEIEHLCNSCTSTNFVVDESYLPFVDSCEQKSLIRRNLPNVIVLNSMSKIFRVPGLRIGFLIAQPGIIDKFRKYMLPWSVNSLAQVAVGYLMTQKEVMGKFIEGTQSFLENERTRFCGALKESSDLTVFPSTTSYLLIKVSSRYTAESICEHLANQGILIRNCSNFQGLSNQFIRVSLKMSETNRMLAEKLLDLP